jgi:hypothetical protein
MMATVLATLEIQNQIVLPMIQIIVVTAPVAVQLT